MRGADAMLVDDWTLHQLWIPATRIGGGTEEALRSIVAERVLGLPKAPRPDADVPFRQARSSELGDDVTGARTRPGRHQLEAGA